MLPAPSTPCTMNLCETAIPGSFLQDTGPYMPREWAATKAQQHAAVEGFVLRTPPCVAFCSKHRPDAPTHAYRTYPPSRRTTQQMMLTHCLCFTCHVHSSQTKEGGINITGTRPHGAANTCSHAVWANATTRELLPLLCQHHTLGRVLHPGAVTASRSNTWTAALLYSA